MPRILPPGSDNHRRSRRRPPLFLMLIMVFRPVSSARDGGWAMINSVGRVLRSEAADEPGPPRQQTGSDDRRCLGPPAHAGDSRSDSVTDWEADVGFRVPPRGFNA